MGLYQRYVLPAAVHMACGLKPHMRQREKIVPQAEGLVLEVGIGTGLNLPFYDGDRVTRVVGLDPSAHITRRAERSARDLPFEVEFIIGPGENIPLETGSVDTVLMTYTLCSILDTERALEEMRRVLRPGGRLLFCEHGAAPDSGVRVWQDRLTPAWRRFGGGCHLNRDIPALIGAGGFRVGDLEARYIPGWRVASFNYWGAARPR